MEGQESLWSADDCCKFLGAMKRRYFLEHIACKPSFPKPFELSRRVRYWYPDEVRDWVLRHRRANQAA